MVTKKDLVWGIPPAVFLIVLCAYRLFEPRAPLKEAILTAGAAAVATEVIMVLMYVIIEALAIIMVRTPVRVMQYAAAITEHVITARRTRRHEAQRALARQIAVERLLRTRTVRMSWRVRWQEWRDTVMARATKFPFASQRDGDR